MRPIRSWLRRVTGTLGGGRSDADINGELQTHREMLADEYRRSGMTPDAARQRAAAEFGSIAAASDACRDRRGLPSLDSFVRDGRMALRSLARTPVLSTSMILVLGLGIGIATAIVAAFHAVVWEALPVAGADRVVELGQRFEGEFDRRVQGHLTQFSYPEVETYRQATRALSAAAASTRADIVWRYDGGTRSLHGTLVTGKFFDVFPVVPRAGRMLTPGDARTPVAVISHGLWATAFASSAAAIGQTMWLDGSPVTIVGVAPAWLSSLQVDQPDSSVWLPLQAWQSIRGDQVPLTTANLSWLRMVGRLADDASIASARSEAAAVAALFDRDYPGRHTTIEINRASRINWGGFRSVVLTVGGSLSVFLAVLFLICGSNAAALLLARGAARQKEVAVRLALGASRFQIVRQLGVEIVIIAAASALTGIVICIVSLHQLASRVPMEDVLLGIHPDVRVFGFAFAIAFVVALLFGLAPARQALSVDCLTNLKGEGSFLGRSLSGLRLRRALISVQIAASLPLLVVAVLFGRGVTQAWRSDPGFSTKGLYAIEPSRAAKSGSAALVERLHVVPGVRAVGRTLVAPFFGHGSSHAGTDAGRLSEPVHVNQVDSGYFQALGVPFAGRMFLSGEHDATVVNAQLARRFWGDDRSALDRVLYVPGSQSDAGTSRPLRVVGVVPALETTTLGVSDEPTYYLPLDESRSSSMWLLVRADPNPEVKALIGDQIRATYSELSAGVLEIDARRLAATRPARVAGLVAGAVGLLALVVAAVGVHGVIAYTVANRTRDIGIYQALGARPGEVLRVVVGWTLGGVAIGSACAVALLLVAALTFRRQLVPIFNGVNPLDLPSFAAGLLILAAVIGVAAFLPARRALGMTPFAALRRE